MPSTHRLITDPPAPGAWNMAVDEALLADAAENGIATLRFYSWDVPTLSLGYFQQSANRHQHAASRDSAAVRRQTGGGAIMHDRELTYSIALPSNHPLARQNQSLYAAVHDAFIAELSPAVDSTGSGWRLERNCPSSPSEGDEPFLCFQRRSPGDVLLIPRSSTDTQPAGQDWKVLGSAQRRHRGAVLQHGSLLIERSSAAPELPGLVDLTGSPFLAHEIAAALSVRLGDALGVRFQQAGIPPALESKARAIANTKYETAAWTGRR